MEVREKPLKALIPYLAKLCWFPRSARRVVCQVNVISEGPPCFEILRGSGYDRIGYRLHLFQYFIACHLGTLGMIVLHLTILIGQFPEVREGWGTAFPCFWKSSNQEKLQRLS